MQTLCSTLGTLDYDSNVKDINNLQIWLFIQYKCYKFNIIAYQRTQWCH